MFSTQACMKSNIYMSCFIYIDDFSCPTNMIIKQLLNIPNGSQKIWFFLCLIPLSAIFQLYHGDQF
jgi:hypothetical protein